MSQPKKIVVIGPESTGKSTLSAALAKALNTVWVPEYARSYLDGLDRPYTEPDLLHIAQGQLASEDDSLAKAHNFLICDTDLYVIKVWSEHSYHRCHNWILKQIAVRPYDGHILTDIDMPWQPDPYREHPHLRHYFYHQYRDIVANSGIPWINVAGDKQTRVSAALSFIENLLTTHRSPLTK